MNSESQPFDSRTRPRLRAGWLWLAVFGIAALLGALPQARAAALLPNGDFEQPDPVEKSKPANWARPDGLGVQWVESDDAARGKAIRMDTRVTEKDMVAQWKKARLTNEWSIPKPDPSPIANTYGLSFYSEGIPVKAGQPYRITFDYKGRSDGAKVWVRGWGQIQGVKRRRWETYVTCKSAGDGWSTCTQVFFPTKFRPEVTEMKVMLFAFYPPGIYWFDNVRLEPISLQEYETSKK